MQLDEFWWRVLSDGQVPEQFSKQLPVRTPHRSILHKTGCDADGQDTVPPLGDALKCGVPITPRSKSVVALAQDKCGCGILIERVTGADSCARQALLSEVLPMVAHWSRHPFAHQVVTTFLVTGSSVHCRQIAEKLSHEAASLSNDVYGCGVIELTLLNRVGRELIVEGLKDHVVECSMHPHGNHVIQRLVEVLPPSKPRFYGACLVRLWREACEPRQVWLQGPSSLFCSAPRPRLSRQSSMSSRNAATISSRISPASHCLSDSPRSDRGLVVLGRADT